MSQMSIVTSNAPAAIGPYSQAVRTGSLLFVSGQIPVVPSTGAVIEGGIEEQANQVFCNLKAILEEAGLSFDNVVKTTVLMDNMDNFATLNKIYGEYMQTTVLPARAAYEVSKLPKGVMIEIELVASFD